MEYKSLGNTGLKVSRISYGFMDFGSQDQLDQMLPVAFKLGINYFDVAEIYGFDKAGCGTVETFLGNSLKKLDVDREDIVISTKLIKGGETPNKKGLGRKHIIQGTDKCLQRLQLDFVDVLFAHRDDPDVPMEEIVRGFNTVIDQGKALYWATSEWSADRVAEAFAVCDKLGLVKPIADQCEYNILRRDKVEKEYVSLFANHGYGTTVWGPLAGGLLTGKYNKEIPVDSRMGSQPAFAAFNQHYIGPDVIEETRRKLVGVGEVAKEAGMSQAQFSLAWVLKNKDVSTAIIGSTKLAQIEENIKTLELVKNITPEIEEKLEKVVKNQPNLGFSIKDMKPLPGRRTISTK